MSSPALLGMEARERPHQPEWTGRKEIDSVFPYTQEKVLSREEHGFLIGTFSWKGKERNAAQCPLEERPRAGLSPFQDRMDGEERL